MWGWIFGNFPSWLAVIIAVVAVIFALRRPFRTEFDTDWTVKYDASNATIEFSGYLFTSSQAPRLTVRGHAKLGKVIIPLELGPIKEPTNRSYRARSEFGLIFTGKAPRSPSELPTYAMLHLQARFSDGASAHLKKKIALKALPDDSDSGRAVGIEG